MSLNIAFDHDIYPGGDMGYMCTDDKFNDIYGEHVWLGAEFCTALVKIMHQYYNYKIEKTELRLNSKMALKLIDFYK